jgi:DNA helicase HerA-like ATPase
MEILFDIQKALASGYFISGTSGSGKTNLAKLIANILMQAGIRVYVFDPSQAWKTSDIPYRILITPRTTNLKFSKKASVVFDISLLRVKEQRRFVEDFCREFFIHQVNTPEPDRIPTFLVFEEAQLYLQQSVMISKAGMEIMRIITTGRNYKIRYGLITQFAANVDKLPVKMTQQRYFGYSDELNDKKYLHSFLKGTEEYLDQLKVGEFFYNFQGQITKIQTPEFKQSITQQELPQTPLTTKPTPPKEPDTPVEIVSWRYSMKLWEFLLLVGVFALLAYAIGLGLSHGSEVGAVPSLPVFLAKFSAKKKQRRTKHHRMPDGRLVVCE